jgi:hypothetical protein
VLAEAEQAGDWFAIAQAATALCISLASQGDSPGGLAVVERGLTMLGDDPQAADQLLLLLHNRMIMLGDLDRLAEADAAVRELVTAAERYASPHRQTVCRGAAADHHYQAGR